MKKIINNKDFIVDEAIEGFVAMNANHYERTGDVNGVVYKNKRQGKVSLIVGGGSGHEPMFPGFVGKGLADAAACGNIFASPDPGTICGVAECVDSSEGILFLYGNYAGDNMNFDMAEEFLNDDGIKTAHVRVTDDCASAPRERLSDRRGIAGDVYLVKIAGAACDEGHPLEEVVRLTEKANANTGTIGIAVSPGQHLGLDEPTFTLGDDEMEYGMGIHGEPGIKRTKFGTADEITETMFNALVEDMDLKEGDEICVLVNGLGATTGLELNIACRKLMGMIADKGFKVFDSDVNNFCTSLGMGGFSITILKLDEELKRLYSRPCFSPYYAKEAR